MWKRRCLLLDFDERAVRVAWTLNLIAGDGQTNVLHLNTLDYELWNEVTQQEEWQSVYFPGLNRLKKLRPKGSKDYREFQFDVLMANPPFAGDIKEPRMIARYDLAKKPDGKWQTKVGRDILFIERNLDFLKPGGRMAIVLPQGRFNNSSDKNIRDFIAERCRILAVVGLHGNTFKPHTGTKTSVLFVQKWNDDSKAGVLCPRQDDYNIFFATMRKSGKDNSGEKIWRKISPPTTSPPDDEISELMPPSPVERMVGVEGDFLQDIHGHLVVDHDLYNHEGLTEDGIAEAFIEFAKKENLSFFEPSPSVTPFDAVKYQQLMDGLEAVELSFNQVLRDNLPLRIDSEYFGKYYLACLKKVEKRSYRKINDFSYVTDGIHESIDFDEDSHILSFSAKYPKENYFDLTEIKKISERQHNLNPRTQFQQDDVIISTVGTIGNCAVVDKSILPANSDRDVGIIRIKDHSIKPRFLSTFLVSRYGRFQSERESTGNVQLHLFIYKIKEIKIPELEIDFQEIIEGIVEKSKFLLDYSKTLYQQAEELLLSELGLKDWQPTEKTVAVKSFAQSFLSSGRFDAEYYQPKYDDLLELLENCQVAKLKDIVSIKKSIEPGSDAYQQNGLPFVRVSNLSKFEITAPEIHISHNFIDNIESFKPKKDTILLSKDGSLGIAHKIENDLEAITSGAILHLKIKNQVFILPDYLTLILNSIIVKLQAERDSGGSIIQHWRVSEIENILIPVINISLQEDISKKLQMSFIKRKQSKQLLEIAKTSVERAIETDEATATAWMNQQLEALGIDLTTTI